MSDQPESAAESPVGRLRRIMAQLRDPETGCPWDREQDFASIAPFTVEEAYEVQDAIDRADWDELRGELGDLLLQVVFHAQMAEEAGLFDFDRVATGIADKLERRHPHIFGEAQAADSKAVNAIWEAEKAAERNRKAGGEASLMDGVAVTLPALQRAVKLQKRAARAGFDWPDTGPVFDKLREEAEELLTEVEAGSAIERLEDELGDLLFVCANIARRLEVDPERAARRTCAKFERRFRFLEAQARAAGAKLSDFDLDQQEAWWQAAKGQERADPP